jgi:hypothetical protein
MMDLVGSAPARESGERHFPRIHVFQFAEAGPHPNLLRAKSGERETARLYRLT